MDTTVIFGLTSVRSQRLVYRQVLMDLHYLVFHCTPEMASWQILANAFLAGGSSRLRTHLMFSGLAPEGHFIPVE